jgi:sarcosine oxidase
VLAKRALTAQLRSFDASAGRLVVGSRVAGISLAGDGVQLTLSPPQAGSATMAADVVVLAPGPWSSELLSQIGIDLVLRPRLEQVTYLLGGAGWEDLPCWFEGGTEERAGLYAMPTPGMGYKIGIHRELRPFAGEDLDRSAERAVEAEIAGRAREDLGFDPVVAGSQVCCWTASPDERFVVDRLHGGRVVLACGDSGEGFKFSALMGEILADLVEGAKPSVDMSAFGLARFAAAGLP